MTQKFRNIHGMQVEKLTVQIIVKAMSEISL